MARMAFLLAAFLTASTATLADGLVLCARSRDGNPTGSIRIRDACRPSEILVDPVALNLQGPPGATGRQGRPRGNDRALPIRSASPVCA